MRNTTASFEKSISSMVIISKKIYVEFIFALGFSKEAILFLIYLLADKGNYIGMLYRQYIINLFLRPEYVATWLGLAKIGVIPALINYNLKQNALVHTVRVANSKAIIYGVELSQEVSEILSTLKNGTSVAFPNFSSGPVEKKNFDVPNTVDLNEILDSVSASPVPMEIQNEIGFNDKLLYIYTSGTTGLPKAAVIKHSR